MTARLILDKWRRDPVSFVREVFGAEPDQWQADVLMDFAKYQRVAMQSSKGTGKSTILAWCAWNFLVTRLSPKIVATSISYDNLSDGLWTEMAKWQNKSPLLKHQFEWTKTRISHRDFPETWFMSARTWSKSGDTGSQADSLAGIHSDYVLFILDEAGGIPDGVMAAAEAGLASGIETKIIIAGNPTHLEGPLFRAATNERHLWRVTEITSDPDNPKRSSRVSLQWAKEQRDKYGVDSPWYIVNVLGRFPPSSINSLLGPDEVSAAMKRECSEDAYNWAQKRLGVDVARFGVDRTVIFPRQGLRAFKPVTLQGSRTPEIAARIMAAKIKWGSEAEFIDGTGGFGSGVVDALLQAGGSPHEIHFSGKPIDPAYLNKRAEMWFNMAEWIRRGGILPNLPELARELTAPQYTFVNGKFQLEPKDQIKERLGFSPDLADSLCFVGETIISTKGGDKRIDSVAVGDFVLTPWGYRKVLKVWVSRSNEITEVTLSNGNKLKGTPKHKVFTWNSGWKCLDALTLTDEIELDSHASRCMWLLRKLFTKADRFNFKVLVDTIVQGGQTPANAFCIDMCGLKTMAQYLRGFTSIIRTATGRITTSRTLRLSTGKNIAAATCYPTCLTQNTESEHSPRSIRLSEQQPSGTDQQRVSSGIALTALGLGRAGKPLSLNASSAVKALMRILEKGKSSALNHASRRLDISNTKRQLESALSAVRNFCVTSIVKQKAVVTSVQTLGSPDSEVFNLTVDEHNVYYANGLLVANCLTFALPDTTSLHGPGIISQRVKVEYNPFEFDKHED